MLSLAEGTALVQLAREAIRTFITKTPLDTSAVEQRFGEKRGVFIELLMHHQLRGKAGNLHPTQPLYKAVITTARDAAFNDPLQLPLRDLEFSQIEICLTILTPPKLLAVRGWGEYLQNIKLGVDGITLDHPLGMAFALPERFRELDTDVEGALDLLCAQAGVPIGGWRDTANTRVYTFQAQRFVEKGEKIIEVH